MSSRAGFWQGSRIDAALLWRMACLCTIFPIASACATTKPRHIWTERALQAETLQHRGDLDVAEATYAELLADAPDVDRRRWLLFNLGLVALERGDLDTARTRFARVYEDDRRDQHGANARYEVAKLAPPEQLRDERLAVIRRYPEQVAADFALADILNDARAAQQHAALKPVLEALAAELPATAIADNILFELALLRRDTGDPDGALEAFRVLYRDHQKGPLADDALWEMANIYREHQMWEPAIALMTRIALDVETSWFIGSYDSDWVDNATYDIAFLNLVFRDDYPAAQKWFERYLRKFPDGLLADDAAWNLVQLHRLRGDDDGYHTAMRAFVRDFPESRYVRRAAAQLGDS